MGQLLKAILELAMEVVPDVLVALFRAFRSVLHHIAEIWWVVLLAAVAFFILFILLRIQRR